MNQVVDATDAIVILRRQGGRVMGELLHTDLLLEQKNMSIPVYLEGEALAAAELLYTIISSGVEAGVLRHKE